MDSFENQAIFLPKIMSWIELKLPSDNEKQGSCIHYIGKTPCMFGSFKTVILILQNRLILIVLQKPREIFFGVKTFAP